MTTTAERDLNEKLQLTSEFTHLAFDDFYLHIERVWRPTPFISASLAGVNSVLFLAFHYTLGNLQLLSQMGTNGITGLGLGMVVPSRRHGGLEGSWLSYKTESHQLQASGTITKLLSGDLVKLKWVSPDLHTKVVSSCGGLGGDFAARISRCSQDANAYYTAGMQLNPHGVSCGYSATIERPAKPTFLHCFIEYNTKQRTHFSAAAYSLGGSLQYGVLLRHNLGFSERHYGFNTLTGIIAKTFKYATCKIKGDVEGTFSLNLKASYGSASYGVVLSKNIISRRSSVGLVIRPSEGGITDSPQWLDLHPLKSSRELVE